jgi:outer membrane immunogenic protein
VIDGSAIASTTSRGGCPGAVCPLASFNNTATNVGWTVGGGVERAIDSHWSIMAEYLYVDLGSIRTNTTTNSSVGGFGFGNSTPAGALIPAFQGTATINSRVTDNIVRFGINYKPY